MLRGLAVAGALLATFGIPIGLTLAIASLLKADPSLSFVIGLLVGLPFGVIGRAALSELS